MIYEASDPQNRYGFHYFDKPHGIEDEEDDDEDENDFEAHGEHSCSADCCDTDCECDDCLRCSNTGLVDSDSYSDIAAAS